MSFDVSALRLSQDEAADYEALREKAAHALALEETIYRQHVRFAAVVAEAVAMPPVDLEAAKDALLMETVGLRVVQ